MSRNIDEKIIGELKKLGLTEKEAAVYIALLGKGWVGSSKIIDATGLHGQFVYQALGGLEEKGLVQHVMQRGRKKFSANPPERIETLVERQRLAAKDAIHSLRSLTGKTTSQQFEVFQGNESYVAHEFDLLERAMAGCEIQIIGGEEGRESDRVKGGAFLKTMGERMNEYERKREAKKIRVRYLGGENQRMNLAWYRSNRKYFEFRILPGLTTGLVNTNVWPDAVSFNMFGSPVIAFMIINADIATSYQEFFETLWRLGRD